MSSFPCAKSSSARRCNVYRGFERRRWNRTDGRLMFELAFFQGSDALHAHGVARLAASEGDGHVSVSDK